MPGSPEGRDLTQNLSPRLTNFAIGYLPKLTQFVARKLFPNLAVGAQTGEYNILPRGEWLRPQGKKLANYEAPPVGGYKFDKGTYTVDEFGISKPWTARDLNNAQVGGIGATRLVNMNTEFVTFQAALALELETATLVRNAANWSVNKTGVAANPGANQFLKWSDANSTPVEDVKAWKYAMWLATGIMPNKLMLPQVVIDSLAAHPDIIDRIKYTGSGDRPAQVSLQTLSSLLSIEIIVPMSVYNSAQEGAAENIVPIWGADGFLFFAPDEANSETPSAGYHMSWTGAGIAGGYGPQPDQGRVNSEGLYIARYQTSRPAANWVESRWYTVPKVTAAGLGSLITAIL